jgi:hypothetical protein
MTHLLRSSVVKVKENSSANVRFVAPTNTTLANPEGGNAVCMYVRAWIGDNKVGATSVDGGAMINLVRMDVLTANGISMFPVPNFGMRMADDSIYPLREAAWVDVDVEGVIARTKCYVIHEDVDYHLLLSKRWLKRVRAREHHSTNTLFITGQDNVWREVIGEPAPSNGICLVDAQEMRGFQKMEIESQEVVEAVLALLEELDGWEEQS